MEVLKNIIKTTAKILMLGSILIFNSCEKESFSKSIIPTLELVSEEVIFNNQTQSDSIILLHFEYSDKDGDIGYPDSDSISASNFIIDFFEIINNIPTPYIIPFTNDTLNFNQRMPDLTPNGKDKSIKGEITVRIPAKPYLGYEPDSVQFKCQLFDRAGNASNIITTSIFNLK